MSTWALYFAWPAGEVWPNLVASAITSAAPVALVVWRGLARLRREHEQHREAIAQQLAEHHQAVLAAVARHAGSSST